jgi:predicted unusual protein kinase regulating ubiquinone biosynthesis (AarF/ABC1/UbiB family)
MQRVGLGNPRHVVLPGHRRQIALSISKSSITGSVSPFHVLRRNNHGFLGGNTVPVVGNAKRLQLREVRYLIPVSTIMRLNGVIIWHINLFLVFLKAASAEQETASSTSSSANGNGASVNSASVNGNGSAVVVVESNGASLSNEIDGYLSADDAGHLETAAQEAMAKKDRESVNGGAASAAAPSTSPASSKEQMPYREPGGRWGRFKSYSTFQRTWEIWSFAFTFFFKLWLVNQKFTYKKNGMTEAAVTERKKELAVWLREGLVKLGPTFIKIGQQFSTRVDVLSPEFIKELEKLQDNVPPFSSQKAIEIVERGLGKPVNEVFEEFDPEPIAAASLGQVHVAKLNGERVVVKVQRPGLKDLFDIDLKNVRVLAEWLQKVDPKSDGAARDWVAIYDECSRILYQEIDYTLEGKNADRFRENFKDTPWIKVPKVLWDYTTSEVLTLEYVPGTKINRASELDAMGVDRQLLARRTVESYLQQLLTYGFFHADPHPGNIAVDAEGGGRLIYYDFGMMGTIPNDVRGGLLELFYGVYKKNVDGCLDALVKMGVLVEGGDRTAVRRTGEFFLNSFEERLKEQREQRQKDETYSDSFKPQRSKEEAKQRRKQILAAIGEDLLVASADIAFSFPAAFAFVVRSFTVLDGIGKALDNRFDISEISAPYARELLLEGSPQYAKLQEEWGKRLELQNRAVVNLFKGPNMIEDVYTIMRQLERGDLKLRVRSLEAERALSRVAMMQKATMSTIMASMLVNIGTVLSVSAMGIAASASFTGAGLFGVFAMINLIKVKTAEKKEAQLTGA